MSSRRTHRAIPRISLVLAIVVLSAPLAPVYALSPPTSPVDSQGGVSIQGGGVFTAFDFAAGDAYGSAVAASADFFAVGAPMEDTMGSAAGCVYVYRREWAGWSWDDTLYAPDGAASDNFGCAVSAYGETIAVGASEKAMLTGAVYVFTWTDMGWSLEQKIVPAGTGTNDHVGKDVALYQDTLVIGSWTETAWVYTRSGTTWTLEGTLVDPGAAPGDFFGLHVDLHRNTAIVGADSDAGGGSACVFVRTGSTWAFQQKLVASDRAAGDGFGYDVALSFDTALVGAPFDDDTLSGSGSAYVFTRSGTTWTQTQKLHANTVLADAHYGTVVAVSGHTAIISAPSAGAARGMVCLLIRQAGVWAEPGTALSGANPDDRAGGSAAIFGGRIVVGTPGADIGATDAGAVLAVMGEGVHPPGCARVAGASRYLTAVEASEQQFIAGASTVVIATGENWPDALGGSSLCGAVYGPMLLTPKAALPADVRAEIIRLGASRAYVLGGTAAVSSAVENELVALLGRSDVVRLAGASRYETARAIATEAIRVDSDFDGHVLVATGGDFPDATALAPIAAFNRAPIVLANPSGGALMVPPGTTAASIAGGTSAVSAATEAALVAAYGDPNVTRYAGGNRYETAAIIAQTGIDHGSPGHQLTWEGVGLASGTAFPDALSGGVMLGLSSSVLLLTPPTSLSPATQAKLAANVVEIDNSMRIIGGTAAVSATVEAQAKTAAGITP
jgi:putative cell wall-binding protein